MALLTLDLTNLWFHHVVVVTVCKYRKLQARRGQNNTRLIYNTIKNFPAFLDLDILSGHTHRQTDRQKEIQIRSLQPRCA